MRLSNQVRRLLSLIMAVAICMSVLPWTVLAADTATVAEWNYSEEPVGGLPAAATGGANNTGATLELSGATYNKFSSKSISGKGWSVGGYWLLTLDTTGETPNFGTKVGESAEFAAQFIGKTGPFTLGAGVDGISGATITSEAAVEAINNAIK